MAHAAICALLGGKLAVASDLADKAFASDPNNEAVLRAMGAVSARSAQVSNSIPAAKKALEYFTEAREIDPNSANVRNFFLAKKLLWLINQETQGYTRAKIETRLAHLGLPLDNLKPFLKPTDRTTIEHIPKDFICPLTMVG